MDIKVKLKTFIDKQKAQKTPKYSVSASAYLAGADGWSSLEFDEHLAVVSHQSRKSSISHEVPLSEEAQDVVIGTIEPIYFEADNPDVGSHELQKFPDIADIHVINGIRSRLRKQQAIVSRRVSDLIMAKQTDCMEEMAKIDKLQKEACLAVALCVEGRKSLAVGKDQFTSASLHIIANYRKRQRILEVINNLKTIRTLQMTDIQLQKLLKAEDYPGAIQLLLECQTAAANFKQFSSISELSSKLQETLEAAEQQLDAALDRLLVNFNSNTYTKLHAAYSLLNKRQTLMDQLHLHLTSHIHNAAFTVVLGYVELYSSAVHFNNSATANAKSFQCNKSVLNNNTTTNNNTCPIAGPAPSAQTSFSKMQYSDICKYVDSECFLACYLDLCKSMWEMLRNYKAIIRWHQSEDAAHGTPTESIANNNKNEATVKNSQGNCPGKITSSSEALDESSYVQQKLQHGLYRIWQDVQAKIRTFILASDLSHFQFDDFLRVLDVTNRLIEVGSEFCGSQSEGLRETVRRQSTCFFRREHAARLEELHMFLENEAWQVVPLKPTFTVYQLLEFRFLKTKSGGSDRSLASLSSPSKRQERLWALDGSGSPFDQCIEETSIEEDILASSGNNKDHSVSDEDSDDEEDALDRDYVEEAEDMAGGGEDKGGTLAARRTQAIAKLPLVTNTSLAILRLVGKYIRMMKLLQPIACDVFTCLTQLVHYYLYTICHTFGLRSGNGLSSRLSGLLQRIEGDVVAVDGADHQGIGPGNDGSTAECAAAKVPRARASPLVSSHSACSVEGVSTRVVACESLARLLHELCGLRETALAGLLPAAAHHRLGLFFATMADAMPEVVAGVYGCVGAGAVPQQQLVKQMAAVSWSINSLESQHNAYVDGTLTLMQRFSQLLSSVRSQQPVPRTAERSLWRAAVEALHATLLLGFAEARTCSNEGRSLMLLDYQQLTSKLEPLSGLRPLPGRPLVEGFIKAFYLPEAALRDWLQQHKAEYGAKTLGALLAVMGHVPRHARSSLIAALEAAGD